VVNAGPTPRKGGRRSEERGFVLGMGQMEFRTSTRTEGMLGPLGSLRSVFFVSLSSPPYGPGGRASIAAEKDKAFEHNVDIQACAVGVGVCWVCKSTDGQIHRLFGTLLEP